MCCCVKSHRHFCLQSFLVILLVIMVLSYGTLAVLDIGLYLITGSATILKASTSNDSSNDKLANLVAPIGVGGSAPNGIVDENINNALQEASRTIEELKAAPPNQMDETVAEVLATDGNRESVETLPEPERLFSESREEQEQWCTEMADKIVDEHFYGNCTVFQLIRDMTNSMKALRPVDENVDAETRDAIITNQKPENPKLQKKFVQDMRTTILWILFDLAIPLFFLIWSLIAVCRLHQCSIVFLTLIYLAMSLSMVCGMIFFDGGVLLETGNSYLIVVIVLITIYALLAFFHLLLFVLVRCERRYCGSQLNGHNGDNEKMVKSSLNGDDEYDGDDDPNVPLYRNGTMPEKTNDFEEKTKGFKFIDDDMSYIFRKG